MLRTVVAVGALVAACGAGAAMYKWVDSNGVTQYSETPPAGKTAQKVDIKNQPAPSKSRMPQAPLNEVQKLELDYQQRLKGGGQEQRPQRQERADAADPRTRCSNATEQVRLIERGATAPSADQNGAAGTSDSGSSQKMIAAARAERDRYCGK
ncbi:MAG TPA: DUF4124 domain-containing protein [Burkholderiales bacterium]|nr:DUF4124 domain-containing protein [Burkholderiales bacterium]